MLTTPKLIHGFTFATLLVFASCLLHPLTVKAQWTTPDGNGNINSTNTNNVGIGTTAPNYKLDVSNLVDKGQIRFGLGAMDSGGFLFSNGPSHAVFSGGTGWNGGWFAKSISASLIMANTGSLVFFANNGLTAGSSYVPTERMRIDPSGFIGVGTQFPAFDGNITKYFTLDGGTNVFGSYGVGGNISSTTGVLGQFAFFNSNLANGEKRNAVIVSSNDGATNSGNLSFFTANAGTLGERLRITKTGNIGIGTTSPSDLLQVDTASGWGMRIRYTGDGQYLRLSANQVSSYTSAGAARDLYLNVDGGNVGIGTTTPTQKLDVAGAIRSSSGGFVFPDGTVQTTAAAGGGGGTITGVTAGAGLTGGGTSGSLTLNVGAGTGVTVAADTIAVNYGSTAGTAVQGNTSITVAAGTGMSGGGALTLGAGGTVTLTNADRGSTQNIFKNVANSAGTTQFSAASNSDSVRFAGAGGTTVSFDAVNKKVMIDGSTSTLSAANVTAGTFGTGNYTFPNNVTVNGNIAAKYQDMAEWVDSSQELPAGTVVVLDPVRRNHVIAATQAYDSRVAGVISLQPGIALGEQSEGRVLVATTGRVKVKVDASNGPINIGDLLVTSDKTGVAMKSVPMKIGGARIHRPGTLIGKALEPLDKGTGEILVLLSLQ